MELRVLLYNMVRTPFLMVGPLISLVQFLSFTLVALVAAFMLAVRIPSRSYFIDWASAINRMPWIVAQAGLVALRLSEVIGNYLVPAPFRVIQLSVAFMQSQVLFVLAELCIPDLLRSHGPQTSAELATRLHADVGYLHRVLKAAAAMGVLDQKMTFMEQVRQVLPASVVGEAPAGPVEQGEAGEVHADPRNQVLLTSTKRSYHTTVFKLNALSAVLCSDHPNSLRNMTCLAAFTARNAHSLPECVRTGRAPVSALHGGKTFWEVAEKDLALQAIFNNAMVEISSLHGRQSLTRGYDWYKYTHVVDVGGGLGGFLVPLLEQFPHMRGTLFDLPHVIDTAEETAAAKLPDMLPRLSFVGGSFLSDPIPTPPSSIEATQHAQQDPRAKYPHTAYVLRNILHDWDDVSCIKILRGIREAMHKTPMGQKSSLVVIEPTVVNKVPTTLLSRRMVDMQMLVNLGAARERDESELKELLQETGFSLDKVVPTRSMMFIMEGQPV